MYVGVFIPSPLKLRQSLTIFLWKARKRNHLDYFSISPGFFALLPTFLLFLSCTWSFFSFRKESYLSPPTRWWESRTVSSSLVECSTGAFPHWVAFKQSWLLSFYFHLSTKESLIVCLTLYSMCCAKYCYYQNFITPRFIFWGPFFTHSYAFCALPTCFFLHALFMGFVVGRWSSKLMSSFLTSFVCAAAPPNRS